MAQNNRMLRKEVKTRYINLLIDFLTSQNEEVLRTKEHEIAIPVVDAEGNEDFVKILVSIPTGADKGREPYDGYAAARDYAMDLKKKAEKDAKKEKDKAKKIKRDEEYRRKKEEQKKQREGQ